VEEEPMIIVAHSKEAGCEGKPSDGPAVISQEKEEAEEPTALAHRTRSRPTQDRTIIQDAMLSYIEISSAKLHQSVTQKFGPKKFPFAIIM